MEDKTCQDWTKSQDQSQQLDQRAVKNPKEAQNKVVK